MSSCSGIYNIEHFSCKTIKYAGDYDTEIEEEVTLKNIELLIEILETFRNNRAFMVNENL